MLIPRKEQTFLNLHLLLNLREMMHGTEQLKKMTFGKNKITYLKDFIRKIFGFRNKQFLIALQKTQTF